MREAGISRRHFLVGTAATVSGLAAASRLSAAQGRRSVSPNEKLNIAGIGVGGMGGHDLEQLASENIVALCDVDDSYAAKVFDRYPQAKKYRDFRVMLEKQKDIDAVVVATPDHLHAIISMAAIQLGQHLSDRTLRRFIIRSSGGAGGTLGREC